MGLITILLFVAVVAALVYFLRPKGAVAVAVKTRKGRRAGFAVAADTERRKDKK